MFITTVDAVVMNSNTDNDKTLFQLKTTLDLYLFEVRLNWPRKKIVKGIDLTLKSNIFQFGDVYFRQKMKQQ